jgi:hypothetical protein
VTGLPATARELACLALDHRDSGAPRCPDTDEALVEQLVREVRRLRGICRAEADDDGARNVLAAVIAVTPARRLTHADRAARMVDELRHDGWALVRVDP